jgi:hypothetical protein
MASVPNTMNASNLELLEKWQHTHHEALEAEYLAAHPAAGVFGDVEELAATALKLRATADEVFERLVRQEAFGSMAPMPMTKLR